MLCITSALTMNFQWARDRRNAENDRDGDFGPEDYFDGAIRGAHRGQGEEDVDEFAETMLLVFLCLMVSALLYFRGRWVERMRRDEQEPQPQGAPNNGPPPAPPPVPQPQQGMFPPLPDNPPQGWEMLR